MKNVISADWDVDRNVGYKIGIIKICRLDIGVGTTVGIGDGKGVELKYVDEVGSGHGKSIDNFFTSVRCGVSVSIENIIGWYVNIGVVFKVGIANEITFGIDNEYMLGDLVGYFDGLNDEKPMGSLL